MTPPHKVRLAAELASPWSARAAPSKKVGAGRLGCTTSSADDERHFETWVRARLSSWSSGEIRAFHRWLLDESLHEFTPAVRAALSHKRLDERLTPAPRREAGAVE